MIFVDIKGRLGNQLFQYAFTRTIQEKNGGEICIQFQKKSKFGKDGQDGWENSLKHFNVVPFEQQKGYIPLWIKKTSVLQLSVAFLSFINKQIFIDPNKIEDTAKKQLKWFSLLNKYGLFWIYNGYYDFFNLKIKNVFVKGTFEDPRYFENIRPKLLKEFEPKHAVLDQNLQLYNDINASNSICVTIRSFKEIKHDKNVSDLYNVCTPAYFSSAIEKLNNLLDAPKFFIFSDDIAWVKDNIDLSRYNVTFENEGNPIWEKLRLMYSCKHFIISNSTFSWWVQYLSRNENKIVVAPKMWFNDKFDSPLLGDDWIKM